MKILGYFHTCIYQFWKTRVPDATVEQLQKLYVGKSKEDVIQNYWRKIRNVIIVLGLIVILLLPIAILLDKGQENVTKQGKIKRQSPGGMSQRIALDVRIADDRKNITVEVAPRNYTAEELQQQFTIAKQYIEKNYLGSNVSADQVTQNLMLSTEIPDSAISIEWQTDSLQIIEADGTIHWDRIENKIPVEIKAILSYGEKQEELPLELTLCPPQRNENEQLWIDWDKSQVSLDTQTGTEEYMQLPQEVDGQSVIYQEPCKEIWKYLLLAGGMGMLFVPAILNSRIRQKIGKREKELAMDYPEMLEQYVLLIGAGMTMKGAWTRIATEYLKKRQKGQQEYRFVYEEMLVTVRELESGMSEGKAYELFGKRLGILSYMKFSTLLVQNLRKGSADLLRLLEYEATDAFRERKERAKVMGEEAGTKLLMPMMLMLVIVLAMIIYAAFRSM